jgi:hypothetical protein
MTHDTLTTILAGKRLTRIVNRTAQNPLPWSACRSTAKAASWR